MSCSRCLWVSLTLVTFFTTLSASSQCQFTSSDAGKHVLRCGQRTLQSSVDVNESELNKATILNLACSNRTVHESQLKRGHFGHLPNLEVLDVQFCKIRRIPSRAFEGLSNLKVLSIQSHNAEWSSIFAEMEPDSLRNMSHLQDINLAYNNLWSLPPELMCGLNRARLLNVSSNHLVEVSSLGLSLAKSPNCRVGISELDLSRNFIATFKGEDLSQAPGLKKLYLARNQLTALAEDAFSGLKDLLEIDLADNQLAALAPKVFNTTLQLQKLSMQNNSLSLIPSDLFLKVVHLKFLNLSNNLISSHLLSSETFGTLSELEVLDLSFNKLAKIDVVFGNLTSLKELYLHNNLIHSIEPNSLQVSVKLSTLDLSFNKLFIIQELAKNDREISVLRLGNNEIQDLNNFTMNCGRLVELSLQENLLKTVPTFLKECKKLKTLDLSYNKIQALQDGAFSGLDSLFGLSLAGNQLVSLSNASFVNVSSQLSILNLANNKLEKIEIAAFLGLKELRALRLDENGLSDINGLVSHLSSLNWLNMSSNKMEWFDYAFIPNTLSWLDLSHNQVSELGNFYSLTNFALETIIASHNLINKLSPGSLVENLVHVRLNNNQLTELEPNTFYGLPDLQVVDLQSNLIQKLTPDALSTSSKSINGRPRIFLSDNPLQCDCQLSWMPSVNLDSNEQSAFVADLSKLICFEKDWTEDSGTDLSDSKLIVELSPDDFLCQYETHCSESCLCCNFYACDCRLQCPFGCKCNHNVDWTSNIVTCSAKNHTHVPALIPIDTTTLYLDGNRLHHIDQQSFLGQHQIQKLFLNSSNIVKLGNNSFARLFDLKVLHLQNNKLADLRGNAFSGLLHLQELYLHNNVLTFIEEGAFAHLKEIEVIQLNGNMLTTFNVWNLRMNKALRTITLSQNPWSCQCDFLAPFNNYLESYMESILDYEEVKCVSDNIIQKRINGSEPCPPAKVMEENPSLIGESISSEIRWATIIVPSCVAILIVILAFLAVCVFRKSIKTCIYSISSKNSPVYGGSSVIGHSLGRVNSTTPTHLQSMSRLFDVYVMYSKQETEFVHHTLSPTLESGSTSSYKLCLHQRDLPPSAPVDDTISAAIELSERVLIVLTNSFLQSEWSQTRNALFNSFPNDESHVDKLIILLLDDINEGFMQSCQDLHHFLQSSPVIRWGSPGYLSQLRFYLPEPALLTFQRNITLRSLGSTSLANFGKLPSASNNHTVLRSPTYTNSRQELSVYSNQCGSEHTYHSIQDPIYQTLETHNLSRGGNMVQILRPVFLHSPGLMLQSEPSRSSHLPTVIHSYTHSTSSGQQLLTPNSPSEYQV